MRLTCDLCAAILIVLGILWGVFAFSGFNALLFLCFYSVTVYRSVLAIGAVCALFLLYALAVFKPFKGLK